MLLFHRHQEALQFSSLSAPRVISSAYLRLLIFLLAIMIPACDSSSLTFHIMYSTCKLNKQGNSTHLVCQFFNFRYSSGRKVLIVVLMFAFPQWYWRHLNMLTCYSFIVSACLVYKIIFCSNTVKAFSLKIFSFLFVVYNILGTYFCTWWEVL